jgi:hypothetical protein
MCVFDEDVAQTGMVGAGRIRDVGETRRAALIGESPKRYEIDNVSARQGKRCTRGSNRCRMVVMIRFRSRRSESSPAFAGMDAYPTHTSSLGCNRCATGGCVMHYRGNKPIKVCSSDASKGICIVVQQIAG